jgi:nitrite reductase/ring-hydroxylating ferredoxin subunit
MRTIRRAQALTKASIRKIAPTGGPPMREPTFVPVGKAGSVPSGALQLFDAAGRRVTVANVGGSLYAFDDTCTHFGCSLAEGDLTGTTLQCICHGSRFDVTTGAVIRGPAQRPVATHQVRVVGDELQVEA